MERFETAFSLTPNPQTLYPTDSLKTIIERIDWTLRNKWGLTCILGDDGTGKTSVVNFLDSKYKANKNYITTIIQAKSIQSDFAMLKEICSSFGLDLKRSSYDQYKLLEAWLIQESKKGKNVVIFIDEAQNLTFRQLEQVKYLLNLEPFYQKLIQVVLVGHSDFRNKLFLPKNKAILSRMFGLSKLSPFNLEETKEMISFRCNLAQIDNPFSDDSIEVIYHLTNGVPKHIIKLCTYSYKDANGNITPDIIHKVNKDITQLI